MTPDLDAHAMLQVAIDEARQGLVEGGIPIGAALFDQHGRLLGRGHNRRVQARDPSAHGETEAFRNAGRQRTYRDTIMVTTLAPCWYCSGLVRQFRIGKVVVGESVNFVGGMDWLRQNARTFDRRVVQWYFPDWDALAQHNARIWEMYYRPTPLFADTARWEDWLPEYRRLVLEVQEMWEEHKDKGVVKRA